MRIGLIATISTLCLLASARAECPYGDLNGDCRVDVMDLRILGEFWLSESEPNADLNGDLRVESNDLALFAAQWRQRGCPIVINEVLAHSHATAPDWIELHNVSSVPVDIGGWLLSDAQNDLGKYRIASGTTVEPFGYIVFYENTHFGNPFSPETRSAFALSENGETLYLSAGTDPTFPGCLAEVAFGASDTDYSFGRYRKSTGTFSFVIMREPTPGRANSYPLVGPVVINEIMYHPADDGDAEYV